MSIFFSLQIAIIVEENFFTFTKSSGKQISYHLERTNPLRFGFILFKHPFLFINTKT